MPNTDSIKFIDVFCKIVDNFGDIGVTYRLARRLKSLRPLWHIRLWVDDLSTFSQLEPQVDPNKNQQLACGLEILLWQESFSVVRNPSLEILIENFSCGFPEGVQPYVFSPSDSKPKLIINVDYLSAEEYAEEFHCLPSLTPLPQVNKYYFMPGFTKKTGGLLLGEHSPANLDETSRAEGRKRWASELQLPLKEGEEDLFWISVFTYEHDFSSLIRDLAEWNWKVLVLIPGGKGTAGFFRAWDKAGHPFRALEIPFQPQNSYDQFVTLCDFNLVRGEESLVRACVSGRPFLWHAYLQEDGYQKVKVDALLRLMEPHFRGNPAWDGVRDLFLNFNHRSENSAFRPAAESFKPLFTQWKEAEEGFSAFSRELWRNGDFGHNLVNFIDNWSEKNKYRLSHP